MAARVPAIVASGSKRDRGASRGVPRRRTSTIAARSFLASIRSRHPADFRRREQASPSRRQDQLTSQPLSLDRDDSPPIAPAERPGHHAGRGLCERFPARGHIPVKPDRGCRSPKSSCRPIWKWPGKSWRLPCHDSGGRAVCRNSFKAGLAAVERRHGRAFWQSALHASRGRLMTCPASAGGLSQLRIGCGRVFEQFHERDGCRAR